MAVTKISKELKWLLKFMNLGCKQGEYNLRRQLRSMQDYDTKRMESRPFNHVARGIDEPPKEDIKIKKPPMEPPKIDPRSDIGKLVKFVGNYGTKGQVFHANDKLELIPVGKSQFYPSAKEYKTFFSKSRISPIKNGVKDFYIRGDISSLGMSDSMRNTIFRGTDMSLNHKEAEGYLNYFYRTSIHFIWYLLLETKMDRAKCNISPNLVAPNGFIVNIKLARDEVHGFYMSNQEKIDYRKLSLDRNIAFDHDGSLPLAIFAFLLDLEYNHKELHKCLRQCECCGMFEFIPEGKRIYCGDECRRVMTNSSRKDNKKSQQKLRKNLDENSGDIAHNAIIKCLLDLGCKRNVAEKIYQNTSPNGRRSLKEFKRTSLEYKMIVKMAKDRSNNKG